MRSTLTWAAVIAAIAVVVAVATVIANFWNTLGASQIDLVGWLAMIFEVIASLALGVGLMTLMFISSRRGYDEDARTDR